MDLLYLLLLSHKTTVLNLIQKYSEPNLRSTWKFLLNKKEINFWFGNSSHLFLLPMCTNKQVGNFFQHALSRFSRVTGWHKDTELGKKVTSVYIYVSAFKNLNVALVGWLSCPVPLKGCRCDPLPRLWVHMGINHQCFYLTSMFLSLPLLKQSMKHILKWGF